MARQLPLISAFFMVILLAVSLPLPAHAAKAGPEGQAKLEKIFNDLLDQYRKAAETGGSQLVAEGKIMVEPSESYYAVTLPHMTLKEAGGNYTEIGMIAINAMPGATPEQWNMTIALPTPIIRYDANAQPLVTANIGAQNFAGVWHDKFKNFVKMNAHYQGINVKDHATQTRVIIPDGKIVYDLKQNAAGLWSGPADFKVSNLQIFYDADGSTAKIGEFGVVSTIEDYSVDAVLDYQDKINAIVESMDGKDGAVSTSGENIMGFYNLITDFISASSNGFDFDITLKDFTMNRPPLAGSPPGVLKIGSGAFSFDMKGMRTGKVNTGIRLSYDGFKLEPLAAETAKTIPTHVVFDLGVNNLPFRELIDLGRTTLQTTAASPEAGKLAGIAAIAMVPQLLTQAQTNMTLGSSTVGNEHYDLAADALFTADIAAVMGATGTANAQIYGIDNLINSLTAAAADPKTSEEHRQKIKDNLATLTIFKMAGQMGKDAQGRDVRTYKLELNQQGQAMLNGTDLKMLLGGAPTGAGAPEETPAP